MKRSGSLSRTTPLKRRTGLPRPRREASQDPSPEVREAVLERDHYTCLRCGKFVAGQQGSIHHRKRRSQGGTHAPENLITLCGTGTTGCHGWVHANIAEAKACGWLVPGEDDPDLISVMVFSEYESGLTVWLTADGEWTTVAPEGADAA